MQMPTKFIVLLIVLIITIIPVYILVLYDAGTRSCFRHLKGTCAEYAKFERIIKMCKIFSFRRSLVTMLTPKSFCPKMERHCLEQSPFSSPVLTHSWTKQSKIPCLISNSMKLPGRWCVIICVYCAGAPSPNHKELSNHLEKMFQLWLDLCEI